MFVQFADPTGAVIIACFAGPQNATAFPNQGIVPATDARWATYYATLPASAQALLTPPTTPAPPSLAQQAVAAMSAGLAITSEGTPALDATYPTSGALWADLKDEALFIASFGAFSSGVSTFAIVLSPSGPTITFTAPAQVQAVVKAIAMYLSALKTIAAANAGTLPAASVTIA